jgi:hypothetical protein
LRIATYLGLVTALGAFSYGGFIIVRTLLFGNPVAGYPSLLTVVLFLGGVQLTATGVLGEYVGRIFNETKNRPLYFINKFDAGRGSDAADERGQRRGLAENLPHLYSGSLRSRVAEPERSGDL